MTIEIKTKCDNCDQEVGQVKLFGTISLHVQDKGYKHSIYINPTKSFCSLGCLVTQIADMIGSSKGRQLFSPNKKMVLCK